MVLLLIVAAWLAIGLLFAKRIERVWIKRYGYEIGRLQGHEWAIVAFGPFGAFGLAVVA